MAVWAAKVGRALRWAWRAQPLSVLGWGLLLAAVWTAVVFAAPRQDLVLLAVCAIFVAAIAVDAMLVMAYAYGLRRRASLFESAEMLQSEALQAHDFRTGLGSYRWLPLCRVRVRWLEPRGDAWFAPARIGGGLRERAVFSRRYFGTSILREVRVSDVLGFARIRYRVRSQRPVLILPAKGRLQDRLRLTALYVGDTLPHPAGEAEGDRAELRRYVPGDPARFIHWKIFGRTGRAMVRDPETAVSDATNLLVFFWAGAGDEASASATRAFLEGLPGDALATHTKWHFSASGAQRPSAQVGEALQLLAASPRAKAEPAFSTLLEEGERWGRFALIVFVPAADLSWAPRLKALAAKLGTALHVIVGLVDIAPDRGIIGLRRWFVPMANNPAQRAMTKLPPGSLPALEAELRAIEQAGAKVRVALRNRGDVLPRETLAARLQAAS